MSPKRRLLNDLPVDNRPTRSNKISFLSYVFFSWNPILKTLFYQVSQIFCRKISDLFSPSQRKSIPERTFSTIDKPIFEPVTFPENIQKGTLVCSEAESPTLTIELSTSAIENFFILVQFIQLLIFLTQIWLSTAI